MDAHIKTWVVFLLGVAGALAPEIIRLYKLRHRYPKSILKVSYWIISIIYAAFGGLIAVILPAITPFAALYAGITFPTIISAMAHSKKEKYPLFANERIPENMIIGGSVFVKDVTELVKKVGKRASNRPWPKLIKNFFEFQL